MAGLINSEDIATVKERSSIEDVVRDHVTLRPAGARVAQGPVPLPRREDARPSRIRPAVGSYHCFGCGEGGDVISFVQKVEHLTFTEAVERLAAEARHGAALRGRRRGRARRALGRRARGSIEAHRVAAGVLRRAAPRHRPARRPAGRDFLRERGFDSAARQAVRHRLRPARRRGPRARTCARKGFTDDELVTGGLSRARVAAASTTASAAAWSGRSATSPATPSASARAASSTTTASRRSTSTPPRRRSTRSRRCSTASTSRRRRSRQSRQAVVVEGYTDVMACHLAGVETAVATCGTAFGADHIKILRRIMRDEADLAPARVIFTFDGDAAGQKAAMRAFADDQKWAVAVVRRRRDLAAWTRASCARPRATPPCRRSSRTPCRCSSSRCARRSSASTSTTAEGRIQAVTAVAPIVASIRDQSLRPEYTREVSGMLGLEVEQVATEVPGPGESRSTRTPGRPTATTATGGDRRDVAEPAPAETGGVMPVPDRRDPVVSRRAAAAPGAAPVPDGLQARRHRPADARRLLGAGTPGGLRRHPHRPPQRRQGQRPGLDVGRHRGRARRPSPASSASSPSTRCRRGWTPSTGLPTARYVDELFDRVRTIALTRQIADAMSEMRRLDHARDAVARAHARARHAAADAPARARGDQGRDGLMALFERRRRPALPDGRPSGRARSTRASGCSPGRVTSRAARTSSRRRTTWPSSAPTARSSGAARGTRSSPARGRASRPCSRSRGSTAARRRGGSDRALDDPADPARAASRRASCSPTSSAPQGAARCAS